MIFLLGFCFQILEAQTRLFYHHYTTDDGLPNNTIYDIKESPDGIIALGTDNGLSFFNGQKFKNFNIQDGLDKPFIIALRYENNGGLLVGNYMGKFQRLYKNKFFTFPYNCESIDEIAFRNQQIFLKSFDNNYNPHTKGTSLGIIYRQFLSKKMIQHFIFDYNGYYQQQISSNINYAKDAVFSANNDQEIVFIENRIIKTNVISLKIPNEIPSVFKVIKKSRTFLLFTNTLLYEVTISGQIVSKIKLPHSLINESHRFNINLDKKGRIWLNLQTKGLFVFNENKWEQINELIDLKNDQNINSLFCDSQGRMWIGTHENGLFCIPNFDILFYFTENKMNFFNSFFGFQGQVFTSNRFHFFQIENKGLKKIEVPIRNEFNLITLNEEPVFQRVSPELQNTNIYKNIKGYLDKKSIKLKDGSVLMFGSREIRILENGNTKYIPLKKPKNEKFYHIVEYGKQWLCNVGNRLFFAKIEHDQLIELRNFTNLPKGFISDVQLKDGILYIAVNNQLYFYKNEKFVKTISGINGVKLDVINSVFFHGNEIWIATVNGLFQWSEKGNRVFNKHNFLPDNDVQSIHFQKDYVFVATKNGIAKLNLDLMNLATKAAKIQIENAEIDGKLVTIKNQEIHLQSHENTLKLVPEIINYESAKNQQIEYKLDEGCWQRTLQNEIEILSFPYGNHRLHVRVRDVNSNWNAISITVSKDYPFYFTFWFWGVVLGISGALFYYYFQQKIRRFKKKTQEEVATQNKMVELRQSALSAMVNPHFVFNSLNAIQYFVNTNQKEVSGEFLAKLSRLVRLFLNQSSEPYISLQDEITRLKMYVELEQLRFYPFDFQIDFNEISEPEHIKIPNMILQPFLENAIIHGISHLEEKDGKIGLEFSLEGKILVIKISDNGFGVRENQTVSHHISKGISIIKERLDALQQLYPEKTFSIEESPQFSTEKRKGHLVTLTLSVD